MLDPIEWTQRTTTVVDTPRIPVIEEARDPFPSDYEGSRYAIQGAGSLEGRPQLSRWSVEAAAEEVRGQRLAVETAG